MARSSFLIICRMAREQGYGRHLTYLLVNKALTIMVENPGTLPDYLSVEFDL